MTSRAEHADVCVVGAGPAGLGAATAAARAGARVIVLDAGARIGGQFWRHGPSGLEAERDLHHDVGTFAGLSAGFASAPAITYLPRHEVWSLTSGAGGCLVNAIDRADLTRLCEVVVRASALVLAPGAYDRQVPFPGWTLPGVFTAGAVQALLKEHGVVAGRRVLVAGTGPFLLPVATGLAARGARVVGVHDANDGRRWLRHLPAIAGERTKLREAGEYAAALAKHRIPFRRRSMVVAAHGIDHVEAVTVARLARDGTPRPGTHRRVALDVLAVGWGFTPQLELPVAVGCALQRDTDGSAVVAVDRHQATSVPGVFAAGEVTGIGGAQLALVEGRIAGTAAALRIPDVRLTRLRDRMRRFATAMNDTYPVPSAWLSALDDDTIVCRCEEVPVSVLKRAVQLGARDARTAKLLSRVGMGWCQGRVCGYAAACLVEHLTGRPRDPLAGYERPVASPIPLGILARRSEK